jgi:hypothetical protein
MSETKWLKTMSENQLVDPFTQAGSIAPPPVVMSGDGTVFYVSVGDFSAMARYKYENNAWTFENFIGTPNSSIVGTKYLPNSLYTVPVATSFDGNTLISIRAGMAFNTKPQKIYITSYVNGEFVQASSEITFVQQFANPPHQSNGNYILKVMLSLDESKMVIITHSGMNTLVFSNGSWNLLPSSPDILQSYFTDDGYGVVGYYINMSTNGMYMSFISIAAKTVLVFKFNNQINNWVLFKTIDNNALQSWNGTLYVDQTFVSNSGIVNVVHGSGKLLRFEYSLTTNNYELINETNMIFSRPWDSSRVYMSADGNTYICRYRYIGMHHGGASNISMQVFRMLKWNGANWELKEFPSSIVPFIDSSQDPGNLGALLGMSSDGNTVITTTPYSTSMSIINTYLNISVPTLHLGDFVKIKETDVNFNESNVLVKDPTVALNVSNKHYVDVEDNEIHALILASATTDTTSTTEYYDLLGQRQTVQSNLATQIENLYQYFFNASRTNSNII